MLPYHHRYHAFEKRRVSFLFFGIVASRSVVALTVKRHSLRAYVQHCRN